MHLPKPIVLAVVALVLVLHLFHVTLICLHTSYLRDAFSHISVSLLLWSYLRACLTNSFVSINATQQQQGESTGSLCAVCRHNKPSRTHHCRKCNRCVDKMDHHCPYVGTCIGRRNYKYYVLFLLYTTVSLFDCVLDAANVVLSSPSDWSNTSLVVVGVVGLLEIVLGSSVAYLLLWHSMQMLHNCTTIEWYQAQKKNRVHKTKLARFPWPRTFPSESTNDGGVKKNLESVLGARSRVWWLLPVLDEETAIAVLAGATGKNIV